MASSHRSGVAPDRAAKRSRDALGRERGTADVADAADVVRRKVLCRGFEERFPEPASLTSGVSVDDVDVSPKPEAHRAMPTLTPGSYLADSELLEGPGQPGMAPVPELATEAVHQTLRFTEIGPRSRRARPAGANYLRTGSCSSSSGVEMGPVIGRPTGDDRCPQSPLLAL